MEARSAVRWPSVGLRRYGQAEDIAASVTWVDEAIRGPAKDFQKLVDKLVKEVFCGGQTGTADEAEPAQ
ncbi:hypothetical protein ACQP2T_31645 [Nonomuraea sp. CA-143628]|uniref:hypothetical protein n=1 Tax=Nonomuraea sp. CA-143628 TaxID=3239997 RepID=UPI003D91CFBC